MEKAKPTTEVPFEHFQDKVPHVSGDDGAADIFHAGDDTPVLGEPLTRAESQGHETLEHHKHRKEAGHTDVEILKDEGADLPHHTRAGHVDLPGAAD